MSKHKNIKQLTIMATVFLIAQSLCFSYTWPTSDDYITCDFGPRLGCFTKELILEQALGIRYIQ